MDIHIGAFMRTTYVRLEGCPCSGYIMEACIETLTWAYTEGHFGEPRMCLERVVLAVGICMEACIETTPGHTHRAFLRTTYLRLGRGVLLVAICMEACIETQTRTYIGGHF